LLFGKLPATAPELFDLLNPDVIGRRWRKNIRWLSYAILHIRGAALEGTMIRRD
jgi:hypothetical protein